MTSSRGRVRCCGICRRGRGPRSARSSRRCWGETRPARVPDAGGGRRGVGCGSGAAATGDYCTGDVRPGRARGQGPERGGAAAIRGVSGAGCAGVRRERNPFRRAGAGGCVFAAAGLFADTGAVPSAWGDQRVRDGCAGVRHRSGPDGGVLDGSGGAEQEVGRGSVLQDVCGVAGCAGGPWRTSTPIISRWIRGGVRRRLGICGRICGTITGCGCSGEGRQCWSFGRVRGWIGRGGGDGPKLGRGQGVQCPGG
jgi:hypothetical protein